jgi:hypothetical protein
MPPRHRTNEQILADLVADCDLTTDQIAALARVSIHTARSWLRPESNASHRRIPDGSLELMWLKLGLGSPFHI